MINYSRARSRMRVICKLSNHQHISSYIYMFESSIYQIIKSSTIIKQLNSTVKILFRLGDIHPYPHRTISHYMINTENHYSLNYKLLSGTLYKHASYNQNIKSSIYIKVHIHVRIIKLSIKSITNQSNQIINNHQITLVQRCVIICFYACRL